MTNWLLPGVLRLGGVRVSLFGLYAAAGAIAALWLSQHAARRVGLSADQVWNAGLFVAVAAFVISRCLLIVEDPRAFVRYPLLVLALPSLTWLGMGLTLVATAVYLRRTGLPVRPVLDAWSPSAAVLGGALALAHFADGSEAGLPTALPWGVVSPRMPVLGRLQPVQLYLLLAAVMVGVAAWRLLLQPHPPGAVAAFTLLSGGLLYFVLQMTAQPADVYGKAWLDPGQWAGLGCMAAGLALGVGLRWRGASEPAAASVPTAVQATGMQATADQATSIEELR